MARIHAGAPKTERLSMAMKFGCDIVFASKVDMTLEEVDKFLEKEKCTFEYFSEYELGYNTFIGIPLLSIDEFDLTESIQLSDIQKMLTPELIADFCVFVEKHNLSAPQIWIVPSVK